MLTRRIFLRGSAIVMAGTGAVPSWLARAASVEGKKRKILVAIFLRGAADAICSAMPAAGRPPALMVALHIWTMAHGVASLFGRADGAQRAMPMSPQELLEAQVLVYLRGLGVDGARP